MINIKLVIESIKQDTSYKTYWQKGVKIYAIELLKNVMDGYDILTCDCYQTLKAKMLNGADDWHRFSEGGCTLIYNSDIAERLCSPSELKKNKNGQRNPNKHENWLDVQTRALFQAEIIIKKHYKRVA